MHIAQLKAGGSLTAHGLRLEAGVLKAVSDDIAELLAATGLVHLTKVEDAPHLLGDTPGGEAALAAEAAAKQAAEEAAKQAAAKGKK